LTDTTTKGELDSMQRFQLRVSAALALLLCSLAAGQVSQCAPADSPRLRFVAQLSVNGCALFVHDTGASDGPHLAVEPLIVPVLMRDAGMLAEAQRQLRHLSPRSVSFATVTNISVLADNRSSVRVLGFLWTPDEPVATLRLGFKRIVVKTDSSKASGSRILQESLPLQFFQSVYNQLKRSDDFGSSPQEALEKVKISAFIISNGSCHEVQSRVMLQNDSFIEVGLYRKKFLPVCRQLRFIRYVKLENCSARVHQRLDIKGHFLIEPLLCHNISSLSSESVRYDYSRDMHYLKLDLVLQDEATRDAVRTQLADLSPRSVDFMRLWTAERSVSSSLSARFEVGPLMASADWRSAQLRLLCGTLTKCRDLRSAVLAEPADLWRHLQWRVTSLVAEQCISKSSQITSSWRMKASEGAVSCSSLKSCVRLHSASAPRTAAFQILPDGRCFVKFQQRLTGRVSFQRSWTEYETGFGDSTDFWIGLSAIHSLSQGGATLRVEMKLWNGSELHAEYAGFQVGDASTGYRMTYREMLRDRLNVSYVALENSKGMRFSTMDRDNDVGDASTGYRMTYREMLRDRSSVSWDALELSKDMRFSTMDRDNDMKQVQFSFVSLRTARTRLFSFSADFRITKEDHIEETSSTDPPDKEEEPAPLTDTTTKGELDSMQRFQLRVSAALALLLCSLAAGQVSQCAPADSPRLRFVAQLSVNGCALFVHDTGASDGPHLAVEPLIVPVLMRDAGMLAEAQRQLRHLSPRSVSFATVTNISVLADNRSSVRVLGFLWTPDEPVATLRLGFKRIVVKTDSSKASGSRILQESLPLQFFQSVYNQLKRSDDFGSSPQEALEKVKISAFIISNGSCHEVQSRVMLQNDSFIEVGLYRKKFLPVCRQLRFIRYVKLENCSARVHQRLDIKGHFLIEPLLCHNISSLSSESVRYDYSRDMHYLKLDLVLQDEATRDAVRTQLADLSPRSVDFMRLWTAERSVSSSLSARFEVGPLMASADWRSAQLRLLCGTLTKCRDLRSAVLAEPADLWRHLQWRVTSLVAEQCISKSSQITSSWRMKASEGAVSCSSLKSCVRLHSASAPRTAAFQILPDGRCFVKFQQRLTGRVSFQRSWTEYETGFGDSTDFWIGLYAIHSLSQGGATLRVEMKLWNGSELHAEYAGFQVGDASTGYRMTYREMPRDRLNVSYVALENSKGMRFSTMDRDNDVGDASTGYRMTYREMLRDRSSVSWDALELSKDMRFSTMDRDNDVWDAGSCSNKYGKGGWWL
uniref:Fibrinogen C-terminal domain-containing protein n=1 Tax=Macrostomum lignano TaxID=282301 RepID=A0A1I8GJI4_9PLAT